MKKITSFIILILITSFSFGQDAETLKLLSEISGKWKLDESGNVTYARVIAVPGLSKKEIYNRVLNFFIYSFDHGKYEILTQSYELSSIVGTGQFDFNFGGISDCINILRIDVKDGKIRAILTLTEYELEHSYEDETTYYTVNVKDTYPVNFKSSAKTFYGKRFYYSHYCALHTLHLLEKFVNKNSTSKDIKKNDW